MATMVDMEYAMSNADIEFPEERENLIVTLKYLAQSETNPVIMENDHGKLERYFDFDMAVHQIFDDMGNFAVSPERHIGFELKNKAEAAAMQQVVAAVELVLSVDNPASIDSTFTKTARWQGVVASARSALEIFMLRY